MYGTYRGDVSLSYDGITLETRTEGGLVSYRRTCNGEVVEKVLATPPEALLVHPVPPLYLPKAVARHLEVSFPPVVVGPGEEAIIYLTFPLETGVFAGTAGSYDVLDIFSKQKAKYTQYGSGNGGKIARWCESRVSPSPPGIDCHSGAVLELSVRNQSRSFTEVRRAVFEDTTIYLYFDKDTVFMTGIMEVFSDTVAETRTLKKPPREGMQNALPPFAARNLLPVEKGRFMMEFGV